MSETQKKIDTTITGIYDTISRARNTVRLSEIIKNTYGLDIDPLFIRMSGMTLTNLAKYIKEKLDAKESERMVESIKADIEKGDKKDTYQPKAGDCLVFSTKGVTPFQVVVEEINGKFYVSRFYGRTLIRTNFEAVDARRLVKDTASNAKAFRSALYERGCRFVDGRIKLLVDYPTTQLYTLS